MFKIAKKDIGNIGEDVSARYLESKGFVIIERNVRFPLGEIDIVAQKGNILHFFEVKTSVSISRLPAGQAGETHSSPIERISREKLRKMRNAVLMYLKSRGNSDVSCQLDGISVILNQNKHKASVRVFENILA